ncbi:MAG: transcription termination/antitermination protein NusA [Dehalococcoidales bacterium]|nr:transcription termination/antitermination protein NusA [Dehalococcoidales bacterium]
MKSDFVLAITQLSAEKNLPPEVVIKAVETALVSAYKKDSFAANQNVSVKINPSTGAVQVWAEKTVVEKPSDHRREISLDKALEIKPDIKIGDTIEVEATPHNAGRIAAQTAKQVILQRLHEAEHSAIFEEYADKEGDIITGVVRRIEPKQVFIDLGRTEAVLPAVEQMHNERYRLGQRIRIYLLEVAQTNRGPLVVVSRSHPNLLRRLFEMEVPEISNGAVELISIAREAGFRSKVAVAARQEGIDPVGCCVGLRGIRIQNIVNELSGEKIDVVMWSSDASAFIKNALSPAKVLSVEINEDAAAAIVPDGQLSLAIGREGQNVRLAAKLTGWRIDIKSASEAEAEAKARPLPAETEEVAAVGEDLAGEIPAAEGAVEEPVSIDIEEVGGEEVGEPLAPIGVEIPPLTSEPKVAAEKAKIRFAEEIMIPQPIKPGAKAKKKKKKGAPGKESAEDGIKIKKLRRMQGTIEVNGEDEEY